jgi:2',3'-cyclic-nucleotide 2'-phosphodiesterase (5'-nucleotidase family)
MTELTRRKALGVFAATGAAVATTGAKAQAPQPRFTLVMVNDIDKFGEERGRGGYARVAAIVKAERARGVPVLFAHAGDCLSPSLMSGFDQGAHIVEMQNKLGIDVFVPGNHEFDFGKDVYFKRASEKTYPILAANLRDAAGNPLANHADTKVFELGGVKVGVVGLALPVGDGDAARPSPRFALRRGRSGGGGGSHRQGGRRGDRALAPRRRAADRARP